MNSSSSGLRKWFIPVQTLALVFLAATIVSTRAGEARPTSETIPVIILQEVPLSDAIKNLARQAQINYIVDPRVNGRTFISITLTNVTAQEALNVVLKKQNLIIVTNAATSIARIVGIDQAAKPVPASELAAGSTQIIPLIVMDDVPLFDAINNLGRQAGINVVIDPKLRETDSANSAGRVEMSVRWERVTAMQALASILDNYELEMKKEGADGTFKVSAKSQR